ncbi:ribonuclease M [Aspergillus uvarum CBS 121591]|uniref:ribonuclease T2 n=1 Tax=Aspergillus uvarum CBS 121591 TaxID=1448315 RepID=A0A319BRD5_9EURO|nr:ribonuclease M [Aspergillus uvarum CBS 121591]PYH76076.1 ribonuclease M [Aspergillus uvarum CBS 121591]
MPQMSLPAMGVFALSALSSGVLATIDTCPSDSPLSCQTDNEASCCFEYPGGSLLQTQFWDTDPVTGPSDSWTIHGLWPDNCDGSYQSNCDASRAYTNITEILEAQGRTELLEYMNTYWQSDDESNEEFWEHEWAKHGTCINTIDPSCYTDYTAQEEVGDFFDKTVSLFKTLDSYTALADAGITPSSSKTYKLSDIEDALAAIHDGYAPYVYCSSKELSQLYYYFNVAGNAIDGTYEAAERLETSNCPSSGIKYLPKSS